jgi:hypothetical protein
VDFTDKTPGFGFFIYEKIKFVDEDECGELVDFTDKTPGFGFFIYEKIKFVDEDECGELVDFTDKANPENMEKQAKIKNKKIRKHFFFYFSLISAKTSPCLKVPRLSPLVLTIRIVLRSRLICSIDRLTDTDR